MFYSVNSMGLLGLSAYPVLAEVDLSQSMPAFEIVGLPGAAVKESADRVRSAIRNCGLTFPIGKIIVNLSPADVKKDGALYDLPIFLGILKAAGTLDADLADSAFFGELSLSGEVRRINGALPLVLGAKQQDCAGFFSRRPTPAEARWSRGSRYRHLPRQPAAELVSKRGCTVAGCPERTLAQRKPSPPGFC